MDEPKIFRWKDPTEPTNIPAMTVIVEVLSIKNAEFTASTGKPSFDSVLMFKVAAPGMVRSDAACEIERTLPDGVKIVNGANSYKYASVLEAYRKGAGATHLGTPLTELPGMDPGLMNNLKARGIYTVETLAETSDSAIGDLMGLQGWIGKAKGHIAAIEKAAPAKHLEAELKKRDEAYASLEQRFNDLVKAIQDNGGEVPAPRKTRGPNKPKLIESQAA